MLSIIATVIFFIAGLLVMCKYYGRSDTPKNIRVIYKEDGQIYLEDDGKLYIKVNNEWMDFIDLCYFDHIDLVKLMLKKNMDQIHSTLDGFTGFLMACQNGNLSIAQLLYKIDNSQINLKSKRNHNNCFMIACWNGKLDVAKWLLEIDNTIYRYKNTYGSTGFMLACESKNLDLVVMLYNHDPNQIYDRDFDGSNAFKYACGDYIYSVNKKNPNIIQWFLSINDEYYATFNDSLELLDYGSRQDRLARFLLDCNHLDVHKDD